MTQLIGAGNRRYAVLVTDRRFTENGVLRNADDDDRNKMVLLRAGRLKLGVAFTGLARAGTFETATWVANALHRNLSAERGLDLAGFTGEATRTFAQIPAPAASKLCWILMVGFHDHGGHIVPSYCLVTNAYSAADGSMVSGQFQSAQYDPPDDTPDVAYAMARHPVLGQAQTNRLVELASRDVPPRALVDLGVDLVRRSAADPRARGTIGTECSSAVIWANETSNTEIDYHATRAGASVPTPLLVSPKGVTAFRIQGTSGPAVLPMTHKRAPCPCGSRRRYGQCHMRQKNRERATLSMR